jgi:hypothetical protein
LGGIKENSQSSKVSKQSWGHEGKTKGSKRIELLTKIIDMMLLNQVKNEENKEKEPKPNTGGHDRSFRK